MRLFFIISIALASLLNIWPATKVQAASNVDTQDTAVATNLGLFGGLPLDIAVDPNADGQYVYVTTYTPNGLFSSDDTGVSWTGLSAAVDYGAGKAITIDPATGDVYAAIGDDLLKTTDHGNTWTSLTDHLVGEFPLVGSELAWLDGILVVAVDNGAVQVSADDGVTFTSVTLQAGTRQNVISIAGDNTGQVYAVLIDYNTDTTQVFKSIDHGVTWSVLDVAAGGVAAGSVFYSVAVDPLDADHVILGSYHPDYNSYHSFDGGNSWSALLNGSNRIGGEQTVFDGIGGLYIGIYFTNDASVAAPVWSAINTDTPLSSVRGDIYAVDAVHPTTIYSNTSMGVAKSEDQGATWVDSVDGITAVKTYAITQAENKDNVWLGANGGLAKTANFTAEQPDWEYPILPEANGGSIYAVWVKPGNGEYVVTGSSNFFYYTEDGGTSWTQAEAPDFFGTVEAIVPSAVNNQVLYALYTNTSLTEDAYNGGVMTSADAGKNWEELNFPITLSTGALAVAERNNKDVLYVGIGAGGSETGVYTLREGIWTKLDEDFNGLYVNSIFVHPEDNATLFVSVEADSTVGSLYKSNDRGNSWTLIEAGLEGANHLDAMTTQPGANAPMYLTGQAFGGEGVVYKSTDQGDSWSEYYIGLKQEFFYALLFDGLITGNDRGLFSLQSLGKIKLTNTNLNNHRHRLTITLRDAATLTVLGKRQLTVYRKKSGKAWQAIDTIKTKANGKVHITVRAGSGAKLKIIWKPNKQDRAEYNKTTSRVLTMTQ